MKPRLALCCIPILSVTSCSALADFKVSKTGDTVIDPKALTIKGTYGEAINGQSFQQDAIATHGQYQYVGYYDGKRQVCIARRKLSKGNWEIIRFKDYHFKSNDVHNTISIGICPKDGTIHLTFDHHWQPLNYRVSKKGAATKPEAVAWDASSFGPITSKMEKGKADKITYPRFWQTPDGGLQFCYRRGVSGNGDRMLVDYDAKTGTWGNTRQIDSGQGLFEDARGKSTSRCSYPNGYNYGPHGKLHATWVWREGTQGANHDLVYVYSEDLGNSWQNSTGTKLEEPPGVNSPGVTVADIPRTLGLLNTHGQSVDSQGRIHVVVWHCSLESLAAANSKPGKHTWGPPEARRNHHYWRDQEGGWHHNELPGAAGTRPKIFLDKDDNAYIIYCDSYTRGIHFSTEGGLTIMAATREAEWKDWKAVHMEQGPFGNEMLFDYYRWKRNSTLSVLVQDAPKEAHEATPLRILDFALGKD